MRSAPGVWYTGGYYEKIYQFRFENLSQELIIIYHALMNKV